MPVNDLQLTIGVDASGVTAGLAQAKAAVSDFAPKIEQLGRSASELGSQFKEGFEGIEGLGKALQAAGAKGGEGLAGLGAAGNAAVQVVTTLVELAVSATAAMADWAARTLESNTASAEARQNAAALDEAMKGAGAAFSTVGDTIANAFAPAVTAVVSALAGLAQGFEKSYQQGGTAKMLVDDLVVAFKLLAGGVEIAVGVIVLAIESVVGEVRTWVDQFQIARDAVVGGTGVIGLGFRDLGLVIHDVLSGDFGRAVSDYERGLADIQKSTKVVFDEVGRGFVQLGTDKARLGADLDNTVGGLTFAVADVGEARPAGPNQASPPAAYETIAGRTAVQNSPTQPAPSSSVGPAAQEQQALTGIDLGDLTAQVSARDKANQSIVASDSAVTVAQDQDQQRQVEASKDADSKIVQFNQAANDQITKANDRTLAAFKASIDRVVSTFSNGLARMAMGSRTFAQVMDSVGQQILEDLLRVVDGYVDKWAWGVTRNVLASTQGQALLNALGLRDLAQHIALEAKKTSSTIIGVTARKAANAVAAAPNGVEAAQALLTVKQDAGKTYAGIFASLSQNPVTLPMAAPLAAAGMASVLAVSLASGGFDIPAGVNPLTQLHSQEMVLPARLANPMRAMMDDYAASRSGPWGAPAQPAAASGDTHIHNYSVTAMDAGSFRSFLRSNKDPLSTVLQEMGRAGMRTA